MENYKKSVAILGKGPSILLGNSDMYENFDEIAFVNWPIVNNKYMPQRCDSMFTHYFGDQEIDENRKKMKPSSPAWWIEEVKKYKIKNIFCTIKNDENYINKFIPNNYHDIKIHKNLRYINDKMCFDNCSGLFAIQYYCEQCDIDTIFFIGFDAYIGNSIKDTYYFTYTGNITGTSDPIKNDCHDRKLTIGYLQNLGRKYPKIQFYYKSKINFIEYNNFKEYKQV